MVPVTAARTLESQQGPSDLGPEAERVLGATARALLVLGGPGTGKTTILVAGAARELAGTTFGGPAPLVVAHSRRMASVLRNAITRAVAARAVRPNVVTTHGLARSLVLRYGDPEEAPLRLLTAPEQEFRVRELLAVTQAWPDDLSGAQATRGFARQVRATLARARQLGLDPEDIVARAELADRPEWRRLGTFFEEYLTILDHEQSLDYAELIHRARILLTEPDVRTAVRREVDSLWIDEYAENDPAQLGLLAELGSLVPRVRAFADPDTVAFAFRGAHPRAIQEFVPAFGVGDDPPETLVLRGGHRLPAAIGEAVAGVQQRLPLPPGVPGPELRGVVPASSGGVVRVTLHDGVTEELRHLAEELRRLHVREGVPWSDMAIIVRSPKRQFPDVTRALVAAEIPLVAAGDDLPLAAQPAVRTLLLALEAATRGWVTPDEAVRLAGSPLVRLDAVGLRGLTRQLRSPDRQPALETFAAALLDGSRWPAGAEVPEPVRALGRLLVRSRSALEEGARVDTVLWGLWTGTDWPERLRAWALDDSRDAAAANRDLDALCALFDLAGELDRRPGLGGARAFLTEVHAQQIPSDTERDARSGESRVTLTTPHRSKGSQWPVVFVPGVQEGVWPDPRLRGGVLDLEELASPGLVTGVSAGRRIADERRLFALACSRASRELHVSASTGDEGEANQPSRFLGELRVPGERVAPAAAAPTTWTGLTAALRRAILDPDVSEALRRAAADRLARISVLRDGNGRPLARDADPARWWGARTVTGTALTVPGEITLSASQLASILACPRQYWLGREVDVAALRGAPASLGSVIHALAQHVSSDGLGYAEALAHLDGVWHRVPFEAHWLSGSERLQAEAALARMIRWQAARRADPLGVEVPFDVTVDVGGRTVRLKGTVDRLEHDPLGLRIVDFKTARRAPTRAEAESHPQMGLYQLVAAAGGFDSHTSDTRVVGGELVYLRDADADDSAKVLVQASLAERPYLDDEDRGYDSWVHRRLEAACQVVEAGVYPALPGPACRYCAFASSCPARSEGGQVIA